MDRAWGNDLSPGCDDDAVPTLNDLARSHTSLGEADVEYLHSLVSDWQLLADLSFADLILWAPAKDRSAVTAAANRIDVLLRSDPLSCGESRGGSSRVFFVPPLGVDFEVHEDDRLVTVLAVWRVKPRPPKQ